MAAQPTALIMAAGQGTRMRSAVPKVLHTVCGRPMLHWVIEAAREAGAGRIVCVTRPGTGVAAALPEGAEAVEQSVGEGTGAAVLAARDRLEPGATVLTLSGDHPLIAPALVDELAATHAAAGAAATILATEELHPAGYGRIVRAPDGSVERIVETKSTAGLSEAELAIREVNLGAYAFDAGELLAALDEIGERDGERYLTAVFPILRARGLSVAVHSTRDTSSAIGVNTRVGLMEVEALAQRRLIEAHALAGVTFRAPDSVVVDASVRIGADSEIGPGTVLRGATAIGEGCSVGPHATVVDSTLADRVSVAHSYLTECRVGSGAAVGPFAYLRPGADVGEDAKVGTFVEVKNSRIGRGAKVPHLSYVGDADVGDRANVGAGNITANYDGRRKHRTVIGDDARTGVNTSFVAPVHIGREAYTGAGSVITSDVPDGALGISRPEQKNVDGYADRVNEEPRG
jgi:bifunctional UDP-N-acetylglucosamine pyrophosphorylase/glucosamine-1-phosphate N-acetyltransferase